MVRTTGVTVIPTNPTLEKHVTSPVEVMVQRWIVEPQEEEEEVYCTEDACVMKVVIIIN